MNGLTEGNLCEAVYEEDIVARCYCLIAPPLVFTDLWLACFLSSFFSFLGSHACSLFLLYWWEGRPSCHLPVVSFPHRMLTLMSALYVIQFSVILPCVS